MASVRSVALDVRSSGTTKTYEKKKHSMTKPAMTTTAVRRRLRENPDAIKIWATGGGIWRWDSGRDQHYCSEEIQAVVEEAKMVGIPVWSHCYNNHAAAYDSVRFGCEQQDKQRNDNTEQDGLNHMLSGTKDLGRVVALAQNQPIEIHRHLLLTDAPHSNKEGRKRPSPLLYAIKYCVLHQAIDER